MNRQQLVEFQQKDIDEVANVLSINPRFGRTLLMHFQWNKERVLTLFFEEGKEKVYKVQLHHLKSLPN